MTRRPAGPNQRTPREHYELVRNRYLLAALCGVPVMLGSCIGFLAKGPGAGLLGPYVLAALGTAFVALALLSNAHLDRLEARIHTLR